VKLSELRRQIDEMVLESIRKHLPEVMNEVLVRTVINSGALTEGRPQRQSRQPRKPKAPKPQARQQPRMSLDSLLDESAGAEFYEQAGDQWGEEEHLPPQLRARQQQHAPEPPPQIARNFASLPPMLQEMAEDSMQDLIQEEASPGLDVSRGMGAMGLDMDRMRNAIKAVDRKAAEKRLATNGDYEARRIEMQRQRLEVKPRG